MIVELEKGKCKMSSGHPVGEDECLIYIHAYIYVHTHVLACTYTQDRV